MLNENFENVCDDYYEKMTSNCQRRLKEDWTAGNDDFLRTIRIMQRFMILKGWFHCHLCFIPFVRCPVFQNKLQFG